MSTQRDALVLVTICAVVILLSLLGLVAAFVTGLGLSLDGLLLILTCLMMGGLFSLMLFSLAKEQGWLPARRAKEQQEGREAKEAAKPAEAAREAGKQPPAAASAAGPRPGQQEGGK